MKDRILDVIKWGLIIVIAGAVFYLSGNLNQYRYDIVGIAKGVAYKIDKKTGQVWFITPTIERMIKKVSSPPGFVFEKKPSAEEFLNEKSEDK